LRDDVIEDLRKKGYADEKLELKVENIITKPKVM